MQLVHAGALLQPDKVGAWSCHASYWSRVEVRTGAGTRRAHSGSTIQTLESLQFSLHLGAAGSSFEIAGLRGTATARHLDSTGQFAFCSRARKIQRPRRAQIASALKFDSRSASPLAARRTKQRRSITPSPRARKIQTRAIAAQNTDARHRRATAQTRDPPPAGRPRCSGSTSTGRRALKSCRIMRSWGSGWVPWPRTGTFLICCFTGRAVRARRRASNVS